MNRLTDIQEIGNYLELVYKHPRNVTKKFQKDISSRTKDIKQFSQLTTHRQTDKCKSRADPTRGGSAKNSSIRENSISYLTPCLYITIVNRCLKNPITL